MVSSQRYQQLLDRLEDFLTVHTVPEIESVLLPGMAALLDATMVIYHRTPDPGAAQVDIGWPPSLFTPTHLQSYARLAVQHPLVRHLNRPGAVRSSEPIAISDLVPLSSWRASEVYREALAPLGGEDQLLVVLRSTPTLLEALTVTRWSGTFGLDDRELLRRARPHLVAAVDRALAGAAGPGRVALQVRPSVRWVPLNTVSVRDSILTGREDEVMTLMSAGHTTKTVARRLGVSPRTVSKHLENVYRKLQVNSRAEALGHRLSAEPVPPPSAPTP